jgi:hypothetical protein
LTKARKWRIVWAMGQASEYHIRLVDGRMYGPAPLAAIVEWAKEGRVPADATLVPVGEGEPMSVLSRPEVAFVLNAPPVAAAESAGDEGIATLIPYRNPPALTGYYFSIASLLPIVGAIAGPIAIRLGIVGLRKRRADPRCHGLVHAWIAIVVGSIGTLISVGCLSAIVVSLIAP